MEWLSEIRLRVKLALLYSVLKLTKSTLPIVPVIDALVNCFVSGIPCNGLKGAAETTTVRIINKSKVLWNLNKIRHTNGIKINTTKVNPPSPILD